MSIYNENNNGLTIEDVEINLDKVFKENESGSFIFETDNETESMYETDIMFETVDKTECIIDRNILCKTDETENMCETVNETDIMFETVNETKCILDDNVTSKTVYNTGN